MTIQRAVAAVMLVVLIGLQYRLWVGESSFAHVNGLEKQVATLAVGNQAKEKRNEVLKAEIVDLKSGFDAVEEKARTEWGLVKPDETFFLLVDKPTAKP